MFERNVTENVMERPVNLIRTVIRVARIIAAGVLSPLPRKFLSFLSSENGMFLCIADALCV